MLISIFASVLFHYLLAANFPVPCFTFHLPEFKRVITECSGTNTGSHNFLLICREGIVQLRTVELEIFVFFAPAPLGLGLVSQPSSCHATHLLSTEAVAFGVRLAAPKD